MKQPVYRNARSSRSVSSTPSASVTPRSAGCAAHRVRPPKDPDIGSRRRRDPLELPLSTLVTLADREMWLRPLIGSAPRARSSNIPAEAGFLVSITRRTAVARGPVPERGVPAIRHIAAYEQSSAFFLTNKAATSFAAVGAC